MLVLTSLLALALGAAAQSSVSVPAAQITHIITVRNNLTADNATMVFTPQIVNASLEETVLFNFTEGTHSATQSTFANPCIPAHDTNVSINGFDSGLINGTTSPTSPQLFRIIMHADIVGQPLWFYDQKTCGAGGVGVINAGNVTATWQPLDAFVRNAMRLNGTQTASAPSSSSTGSSSGGGSPSSGGSSPSSGGGDTSGNGSSNGTKGSAAAPGPSASFASVTAMTIVAIVAAAAALVA